VTFRDNMGEADAALLAGLGEDATYTEAGGAFSTVRVFFQSAPETNEGEFFQVANAAPTVECQAADVPNREAGDTFDIGGIYYEVQWWGEPDDAGWVMATVTEK
jgi:hypothetical protein